MSKDYLRSHGDREKTVSAKYRETVTSWIPFVDFLKEKWDEPLGSNPNADEEATGERIWNGISAAIRYKNRSSQIMKRWVTGIAAACSVILVSFGLWISVPKSDDYTDEYVSVEWQPEQSPEYRLPDGSAVWLERGSCLKINSDFAENRRVELIGNATFEVSKVPGTEFVVAAGSSEVVVKGTCFSIYQGTDLNLTLYNGVVEFIAEQGAAPVNLSPAHMLTYVASNGDIAVSSIPKGLQWENGTYKFNQIELPELVDFMENRYNVKISLTGSKRYDELRMTGRLRYDEPLDSLINRICYVFKLECVRHQGRYVLSEESDSLH